MNPRVFAIFLTATLLACSQGKSEKKKEAVMQAMWQMVKLNH